jgi:hypothetical protein
MFRLNGDHARHAHLNKVPVNSTQTVADKDIPEPTHISDDAIASFVEPQTDVAPVEKAEVVADDNKKTANNNRIERIINKVKSRQLPTAFKSQAKAQQSEDQNYIDPVTLLIWVVVIALILIILGVVIPGILDIVLALLLVLLLVMAILYLAGSM